MKQGGNRGNASGFTIIETLIVLAVSSLLLGSALLIINGKQGKTEFLTGINGMKQRLQQIINETASGYYPGTGNFTCQAGAGSPLKFTAVAVEQGANGQCVFMGKVLRFGGHSFDPATLTIYPIAGNRLSGGEVPTDFLGSRPTAIAPGTSLATNLGGPDLSSIETFQYGIKLVSAASNGGALGSVNGINPFAIAFLANPASIANGGGLASGSEQFGLYGFAGWPGASSPAQVVDNIDNTVGLSHTSLSSIQLCFASGSTDQSGLVTITSGLNVSLQIKATPTCA